MTGAWPTKVNEEQMTIVWHVDDLKISHADQNVITSIIKKLDKRYGHTSNGTPTLITVTRGKFHDYLRMKLEYINQGKVAVDMTEYLQKVLEDLTDEFKRPAVTPAAAHLFTVNDKCVKLDKSQAEHFRHVVAQLIFLSKRGRPDVLTQQHA